MNSRDAVLTRIRQQLGRPTAATDRATVETRIAAHTRGPLPVFSTDLVARFREKAASLASTVDGPLPPTAVPAAIARYLEEQKLTRRTVCWPGLESMNWAAANIEVETRVARAVNFVSGPSRTADIEQTVTLGAHGPYRVHIVLVT